MVDLDVHFGDGTAWAFYSEPGALHVSIHLDQTDQLCFPFLKVATKASVELLRCLRLQCVYDYEWTCVVASTFALVDYF